MKKEIIIIIIENDSHENIFTEIKSYFMFLFKPFLFLLNTKKCSLYKIKKVSNRVMNEFPH